MAENKELLKKYARLAVGAGVNLAKGQKLTIGCPVECSDFAVALTEAAFELGASDVDVYWTCRRVNRHRFKNAADAELYRVPEYLVAHRMENLEKGAAHISVSAEDPSLYADVDPAVIAKVNKLYDVALKEWYDRMLASEFQWCVVSVPTYEWASKVFPNDEDCVGRLMDAIAKAVRLDSADPVAEWQSHVEKLAERVKWLNGCDFDALRYENAIGTNLTVGLPKGHLWCGGDEHSKGGRMFIANMPTEEVFTAPDMTRADGVLKSALPLVYNGAIIDGFSLTFKNGEVVDYSAKEGQEVLKHLIETDEGSKRLGEVALVPAGSPISAMGVLFYNTLFDENAACHFALGAAYPMCVKGGTDMDDGALKAHGLNVSNAHVDFMVGTADLSITGIKADGTEIPVFANGVWAE